MLGYIGASELEHALGKLDAAPPLTCSDTDFLSDRGRPGG